MTNADSVIFHLPTEESELLSPFDREFMVSEEDLELVFYGHDLLPWSDHLLNPRRLRGSDFAIRWSQGVWSEQRVIGAVNATGEFYALPYGPSGVAPKSSLQETERYFERLEQAGLGKIKRPDLLIFCASDRPRVDEIVQQLGGLSELPFKPESDMKDLIERAIIAVECENSLWQVEKMPNYGAQLRNQRRLGNRPGLPKSAVVPTIIMKEEDREPLRKWQESNGVPIHIWHIFFDLAFGIALSKAESLIEDGLIEPVNQVFQAPNGATTSKTTYRIYYHYGYEIGRSLETPQLIADYIVDSNGHIIPYVRFEGGKLSLSDKVLQQLDHASQKLGGC